MNKVALVSKVSLDEKRAESLMSSIDTERVRETAAPPSAAGAKVQSPPGSFASAARHLVERVGKALEGALPTAVLLAMLLGAWQLACSEPGASLPPPSKVISDTWPLIAHPFYVGNGTDQGLGWQILASLRRVAMGFGLAAVAGISLGVLIGHSKVAFRALDPMVQVLRMVPPLAWLPLSLATFHQANPSAVFVIFITAIWPIVLNTAVGVSNIPQNYRNIAKVLQLTGPEYFFKIMLPATVPYMFTGLRIGIGMSWIAIIASETLIGGVGIGFFIWDAWNSSLMSEIIIALVYVGLVGFALDRLIGAIGRLISRTAGAR
ncbi:MAG: nitrate ABC transporter, permease protein [Rhodospirillaceae bacterium]|nr:MAG: nitrate ABC transporter, permease protein [Rhodospirillaceae bacterium]